MQWILYKLKTAGLLLDAPLRAVDWKPVSYISSTKAILHRCLREKGLHIEAGKLERLPDTFAAWRASLAAPDAIPEVSEVREREEECV
jgi:hypothetical protein